MTDVRTDASPTLERQTDQGGFIWYELMTPDPEGSKAFYDAVVGWNVDAQSSFPNGYRMIGRSDGKNAGGVLPLTAEMQQHGARPTWLGYIHAFEEIVRRVVLAHVVETEEPPFPRPIEIGRLKRRLEFARRSAPGDGALRPRPFDSPVHPGLLRRH